MAAENSPPYSHRATVAFTSGAEYEWVKYTKESVGIPRSSREPLSQLSEFQPTCGDLTLAGKRVHAPENNRKPEVPGTTALA